MATEGIGTIARRGLPAPDLGEKHDTVVRTSVIAGTPVGCTTAASCPWREIIQRVIQRHRRELEHCYDRALHRQQRAFGATVDVAFAIPPVGGTAEVELVSDSGVGPFDQCVHKRVASWIFPHTGESIRANYPFRFHAL